MTTKYLKNVSGTITEENAIASSAGAGDAGKIVATDANGQIDTSFIPFGVDVVLAEAASIIASGDFVNTFVSGSVSYAQPADGTTPAKFANGFVNAGYTATETATVYMLGTNTAVTTSPVGKVFLSNTTAGSFTAVSPTTAGSISQVLGYALATNSITFHPEPPITLA